MAAKVLFFTDRDACKASLAGYSIVFIPRLYPRRALRRLGLSVDIVDARQADLAGYRIALVPGLFAWTERLTTALSTFEGPVLVGPRSGSKTADFAIPASLPPGLPAPLDGLKVARVESLRPDCPVAMAGAGAFHLWRELVDGVEGAEVLIRSADGEAALIRSGNLAYLAGWPDAALADVILKTMAQEVGLLTLDLPDALRIRRSGGLVYVFNYGEETFELADYGLTGEVVLGTRTLGPSGVAILRG